MPPIQVTRRRLIRVSAWGAAFVVAPLAVAHAQSDLLKKGLEGLLGGSGREGGSGGGLSSLQIGQGLKEALRVATQRVVAQVGQAGGYLQDPAIHIPLPGYLQQARSVLQYAGAAGLLDNLETQINRAAEDAAPAAEKIFLDAVGDMTLADARQILDGPQDAATQYFRRTMTPDLKDAMRPVVSERLQQAGAVQTLDRVVGAYDQVPFAPALVENAKGRLVDHGLDGALGGLFHYLAQEEAAIRSNPAKRTTDLLRQVFG